MSTTTSIDSHRKQRKAKVDDSDSNSDEDAVIIEKPHSPRKRVAKGGKVAVHKAYKTPKEVPETTEVKEFHDRFGEDGRTLEEFGETKYEKGNDKASIQYPRRRRGRAGINIINNINQSDEQPPIDPSSQRRSARLKTRAIDIVHLLTTD